MIFIMMKLFFFLCIASVLNAMDLRLQPKPEVEILPADKGIVSRKQYFVKKKIEKINKYFFSGHLIRNWKPKAELIYPLFANENAIQFECDLNRDVQNCFVDDYAEEVYLRTPPPCFVVIGKCGRSITRLSQEIAKEFGSVLIQVDDIVTEVINRNNETSKVLERLLRLGVSLTLNFILALLSYVAHTAEARHRGYVLCGLPRPPLLHDLTVDQQLNYIFTWENRPTIFINVLFDDEDLFKERTNLLCEIKNSEYILFHHACQECLEDEEKIDEDEDDELMPIKEDIFYERDIDISPSRPWIRLPKDEEFRVWSELELFDNDIRPAIELITSRVDPQCFITVDSRVGNELDIVLSRLKLLQIWKVPVAKLIIEPPPAEELELQEGEKDEAETDLDINEIVDEPPDIAFLKLFARKTISPKYRWELSHYNYICPVSLREGEIIEGKSEFAVIFMKYIYFLRDKESAEKFIQNPRAYVLPIRPKPLCRFFIIGHPYSGKTTLAQNLATEFSIPIINFNTVLKNDRERKKNIYKEFCQQKAELRETIRLTTQAWRDWRTEEEQRLNLIEDWILFIQVLLSRRIKEFYSSGSEDNASATELRQQSYSPIGSKNYLQMMPEDNFESKENVKCKRKCIKEEASVMRKTTVDATATISQPVEGASAVAISTSVKIVQVTKYESEKSQEIEANVFLSSLWKSFSGEKQRSQRRIRSVRDFEEFGELGECEDESIDQFEFDDESDDFEDLVDWCSLLPPQSLSSFLISKKPYTTRQKRQSFHIFLEAASKVYWAPSALKSEFAKWRIPCFMDIPLCEILLDNPLLLLHYIPEWLKERPLIPDPIDPMHPSIIEAGRQAFLKADCITIRQNQEEIGKLMRDAIEKAEREGMRVTGEVISPGGWVVDDMTLDLDIWSRLASENIYADHIYILNDSEPELRRIINMWWDLCGKFRESNEELNSKEDASEEENDENETEEPEKKSNRLNIPDDKKVLQDRANEYKSIMRLLIESARAIAEGDEQLDAIYRTLVYDSDKPQSYLPQLMMDPFCLDMLKNSAQNITEDSINEEALITVQTLTPAFSDGTHSSGFFSTKDVNPVSLDFPLGAQLEIFTENLLNQLKKNKLTEDDVKNLCNESFANSLQFFTFLLTLPEKLSKLKEWFSAIGRESTIEEIDITGKSEDQVFSSIRENLMKPFIKKPRELESFEIEEIERINEREIRRLYKRKGDSESELDNSADEEEEDVRIFGESGKLCIVNLERDKFLYGKFEFALRYYGKLYYFWDEDSKNKFIENPEKYAPYYSAIRCYPPLRVFVMGPTGCGKTVLARALADQCSITPVDYLKYINQSLVPHMQFSSKKYMAVGDKKLLLGEDHSAEAKLAKEHFMNISQIKRSYWVDNSIYSESSEIENFFEKILQKVDPVVFKNYPELTYMTIESISKENGDDYSDLPSKIDGNLPETPYISMNEIDSIITNYFRNTSDLADNFLDKSLRVLWTKEPYIRQGFILEGFPLRLNDINIIIKNNWIPDIVIEISLGEDDVIERNIETLMDFWDTKLKHEIMEEKLIEDSLLSLQKAFIMLKRHEILREKREELVRTLEAQSSVEKNQVKVQNEDEVIPLEQLKIQKSEDLKIRKIFSKPSLKKHERGSESFEPLEKLESDVVDEVEKTLKQRYPSFIFSPIFENYDAGKARIISSLIETYRADMNEIDKIKNTLKDVDVTWFAVDGWLELKEIKTDLFLDFDKIKKPFNRRGEFAFTMSMDMAEKLLEQGYYFLSKFGRWCPVQVYRMKNPIHMFRPLNLKAKVTPIAYRNYIYYVAGDNEQKLFLQDPIKYTFNNPHHPNIPLRIAVIGPPKSGKSTLCKRLKTMFDFKIVTMGSALRFALEKTPYSTLAKTIRGYLQRGCFLPLSLKIEALMVCLNDPSCVTQGFVLDGMPFDAAFTQSLAEKGKLPFVIISLVADPDFGKTNRQNLDLKQFRLPYKNRTNLDSRYNDWNETYKRFAQWNQDTYNNLYEVNAKLSVVDIFYRAYDIIRKSFFSILYYVEHCISDKALPLQYLCVSQHEYELRKSSFQNNCIVCWVELNRLNCSYDPPPRSGLFQYLNHFYWACPKHYEKFLECPKRYFQPNGKKWPEKFPKLLSRSELEKNLTQLKIHGFGRCPVTRTDFPSHLDWEGSFDFAVFYDDEVFLCKNKEMLERFVAMPWRYCTADTEFEVNRPAKSSAVEKLGPPKITSLPPIGFLEQTVADLIHESLQILGVVRPLYPNMSPSVTGCTFVALYLKVFNKNNKKSHLEKECLDYMIRYCQPNLFSVSPIRYPFDKEEVNEDDFEPDETIQSASSEETSSSVVSVDMKKSFSDPYWLDTDLQTDRRIWSAAYIDDRVTVMKLTPEDCLIEVPEVPKTNVVLKYQTYTLRSNPLPPISNCITYIYSCKKDLTIPEKFKYDTLHQPLPLFSSPFAKDVFFNPEKQFSVPLYKEQKIKTSSKPDLRKIQRTISDPVTEKIKIDKPVDPVLKLLAENFFPRFQLLDKIKIPDLPSIPKAVELEPLAFNPHRDYAYTVLFSEFFRTTHVLRCYEWSESMRFLEYSDRFQKDLGLGKTRVDFIFKPQKPASLKSKTSVDSYQRVFDAATKFAVTSDFSDSERKSEGVSNETEGKSSLINFLQVIILEKLEEFFENVSDNSLSYDAFEINVAPAEDSSVSPKPKIIIQEIIPYPPLPWDIISRPYYCYLTLSSIFQVPPIDNIAHKRHVSLLDGLIEPGDDFKFVSFPSQTREICEGARAHKKGGAPPYYFVYDFFNLPWTSFLTYPYSVAYNVDLSCDSFEEFQDNENKNVESVSC